MSFNDIKFNEMISSLDESNSRNCNSFEKALRLSMPDFNDIEISEVLEFIGVQFNVVSDQGISQMNTSEIKEVIWFINFIASYHQEEIN